MYHDQVINLEFLSKSFSLFCIGAVEKLPNYAKVKDSLASIIATQGDHWLNERMKVDKMYPPEIPMTD